MKYYKALKPFVFRQSTYPKDTLLTSADFDVADLTRLEARGFIKPAESAQEKSQKKTGKTQKTENPEQD